MIRFLSTRTVDPPMQAQALRFAQHGFEPPVRQEYLALEDIAGSHTDTAEDGDISRWVIDARRYLEMFVVSACTNEALHEMGITTWSDLAGREKEMLARVEESSGLSVSQVMHESLGMLPREVVETITEEPDALEPVEKLSMPRALAIVRSILESCPIAVLTKAARTVELEEEGHRCQKAYWALEGFVRRNDPRQQQVVRTLGRLYVQGHLSVDDVAVMLGKHPSDAVFILEENGFCRPLEVIRMDEASRAEKLRRIREDRLKRQGEPELVREHVIRDVIASERIEGVDARPWLPLDSD